MKARCKLAPDGGIVFEKNESLQACLLYALDVLREYRDAAGVNLSALFEKVPAPHEQPEYYKQIAEPIDLQQIHGKVFGNAYSDTAAFEQALARLFGNARSFHGAGSAAHAAADALDAFAGRELGRMRARGIAALGPRPKSAARGMDTGADAAEEVAGAGAQGGSAATDAGTGASPKVAKAAPPPPALMCHKGPASLKDIFNMLLRVRLNGRPCK